jgi:hypothetical protein
MKKLRRSSLLPKVKLEMVVPSERSNEIVKALTDAARTGKIGDPRASSTTSRKPFAFAAAIAATWRCNGRIRRPHHGR